MTKPNDTALIATKLASETASKAADLAVATSATAVALATETSKATGIISNDIAWMKKSLLGIEQTLKEMNGNFVTSVIFGETDKEVDDHENRIREIEANLGKYMGAIAAITFFITLGISILLKFLKV